MKLVQLFCLIMLLASQSKGEQSLEFARSRFEAGDYQTALNLLMSIRASHQNSPDWHRMVAQANYRLGYIEPTVEYLQKAIRLAPDNEQYYLDLGEVLSQNNAREAVVAVFEAARKALPGSFKLQAALGVAYLKLRDYQKAKKVFLGLLQLQPNDETVLRLLAECYDITNDWQNTGAVAARIRVLNARNSFGWYYGAKAEYEVRRQKGESLDLAEQYARRGLDLGPKEWQLHLLMGKLLVEARKDEDAVAALRQAIALKSEDPSAHYILARTLQRLGRNRESRDAFKAYNQARTAHARSQRSLVVELR